MSVSKMPTPWFNKEAIYNTDTKAQYLDVLTSGKLGVKMEKGNIYGILGFASRGIGNIEYVLDKTQKWCDINDKNHKDGWILLCNGDGDYGHDSIETLISYIKSRGIPVVFIQSDYGYCEPGTNYWPAYADAGIFGPGVRHLYQKTKKGELVFDKANQPVYTECWGGFQREVPNGPELKMSFVDDCLLNEFDGEIYKNVSGFLVIGGGDITEDQIKIYNIGSREGDKFVITFDKEKLGTPINYYAINRMRKPSLHKALNTWYQKC